MYWSTGDRKLQVGELLDNWKTIVQHSLHGEELMEAFKKFDRNGDGQITLTELKVIIRWLALTY